MKLARARITALRVPLRAPLTTAHGRIPAREGALLELEAHGGVRGAGEALPLPGFGLERPDEAVHALLAACRSLVGGEHASPEAALEAAAGHLAAAPAARAALETALLDLEAGEAGVPLAARIAERTGAAVLPRIATGRLVAAIGCSAAAAEAQRACAAGYRTLKLKLGAGDFARERERVVAVRAAAGPDVALRLDANGGWNEADAARHIDALADLDVELLEQPVPAHEVDALARLRRGAPFAIAADEAVRDEATAVRLLDAGAVDVLVLKPAAVGGPGAAVRIAARARAAGIEVLVTSFLDSALGRTLALHLAAALPASRYAAGLASGGLLDDDLAEAAAPRDGALEVPRAPGLGVAPEPAAVARLAVGSAHEVRA